MIEVAEGKSAAAVAPFWKRLKHSRTQVEAVAMDCSNGGQSLLYSYELPVADRAANDGFIRKADDGIRWTKILERPGSLQIESNFVDNLFLVQTKHFLDLRGINIYALEKSSHAVVA